jgi:hypothetical protein
VKDGWSDPAVLRQQLLNRAMVLAESTANLMQRLSSLPTLPDVSLPRCIDRLRPPGFSATSSFMTGVAANRMKQHAGTSGLGECKVLGCEIV